MARGQTAVRGGEGGGAQAEGGRRRPAAGRRAAGGGWHALVEEREEPRSGPGGAIADGLPTKGRPIPIAEIDSAEWAARSTGLAEVDRVLSGGLVPGSVTLVGGEPGIGKS